MPDATHGGENDARRATIARELRQAADRCCQCTDGHHNQIPAYPYGTDGDVRMIRDLAREIADLLDEVGVIPPGSSDPSVQEGDRG